MEWVRRGSIGIEVAAFTALLAWLANGHLSNWRTAVPLLCGLLVVGAAVFAWATRRISLARTRQDAVRKTFQAELALIIFKGTQVRTTGTATEIEEWIASVTGLFNRYGGLHHEKAIFLSAPRGDSDNLLAGMLDSLRLLAARSDSLIITDPAQVHR